MHLKKLKTQKMTLLAVLALSLLTHTNSPAMLRGLIMACPAARIVMPVSKKLALTPSCIRANSAPLIPARFKSNKSGSHPHYKPTPAPAPANSRLELLEKYAKQLDLEAEKIEREDSRGGSGLEKYHHTKIIAAVLRSESVQLKQPGSAITERKLGAITPAALETLALQLEQEKKSLEQKAKNPDSISLDDAKKRTKLMVQIPAIRNQAHILREQIKSIFAAQDSSVLN